MVGEIMAIGVAAMWASSALFFDFANRKLLPINTNFIRMVFAFIPISLLLHIVSGNLFLIHTNLETWLWIGASGFVGFVFGDYFLFASYKEIHATYTQLIMTLSPVIAAITGFIILRESLTINIIIGMMVTVFGIALTILTKGDPQEKLSKKLNFKISTKGIIFGLLSALGQGVGLVLSKKGMAVYHDFAGVLCSKFYISLAATQLRIMTGVIGFGIIVLIRRNGITSLKQSWNYPKNILASCGGAIVGLGIGVPLSLLALQYTQTAIVSTIIATVPILLMVYQKIFLKRKIAPIEWFGVLLCVVGVGILFM